MLAVSLIAITVAFFLGEEKDPLSLLTSLFGVVSVLFVAKGLILGQYLTVIFLALYATLSFRAAYYGELILVLAITLPSALVAIITWLKNPSKERGKVQVNKISGKEWGVMLVAVLGITVGAYFLLKALHTAQLVVSTVSFITSLSAAYLLVRRSEYYAVFYILNDVILIILWSLALAEGQHVLPSIISYCAFFLNDAYGFIDWRRRARQQQREAAASLENGEA